MEVVRGLSGLAWFGIVTSSLLFVSLSYWIYSSYYMLSTSIRNFKFFEKRLRKSQKKVLRINFPYYNKLSPDLKRLFEERVEHFFFYKKYKSEEGTKVFNKKKLLISAYSAQLTLGMENFHFSAIREIVVYDDKFYNKNEELASWEFFDNGRVSLSWKDFYRELNNEKVLIPVGLRIMAHAIKLEKIDELKQQLYVYRSSELFKHTPPSIYTRETLFKPNELKDNDDFVVACLLNYFGKPDALKNTYPELFKHLDKSLYGTLN
jgi:Mlc titration factor MtfA (ptsG expression regulator)